MASRNHYVVLGVASTETEHGIRAAFRDLAKRHHPDRVGPSGAALFREIAEAYEVLADARRRRAYDHELRGREPEPEPIDTAARNLRPMGGFVRELSLRRDLADARPSSEEIFSRMARNFTGMNVPKGERVMELTVDVALSPEEAQRGARVRLSVPVFARCTRCGGAGCHVCRGQGMREHERPVSVDVPPMSGSGTSFVIPLAGFGIHNFFLNVRVRVDRSKRCVTTRW